MMKLLNFQRRTDKQNIFINISISNMVLKCEIYQILLSNVKRYFSAFFRIHAFFISNTFISNTLRLNVCYLKVIHILHHRYHPQRYHPRQFSCIHDQKIGPVTTFQSDIFFVRIIHGSFYLNGA